jgi:glutathione synthase/RimK-type ligase-like ATP-grasp enzyme
MTIPRIKGEEKSKPTTVVVLAPEDDAHANAVRIAVEARHPGHSCVIVDARYFPQRATLHVGNEGWSLDLPSGKLCSADTVSVWYRRPQRPALSETILDRASRSFAQAECQHAFDIIAMSRAYRVVNRPGPQLEANRKPVQLELARGIGFLVPEYHITNDPALLRSLAADDGAYIFKTLSAPVHTFGETRALTPAHAEMAEAVILAPVIVQRRVPRTRELRVTVVGPRLFCHEMVMQNRDAQRFPDWRIDPTVVAQRAALDAETASLVETLMSELHLDYGAIDFIEDEAGRLYFLEINPGGQFLFAEIDAGDEITGALADLLVSDFSR